MNSQKFRHGPEANAVPLSVREEGVGGGSACRCKAIFHHWGASIHSGGSGSTVACRYVIVEGKMELAVMNCGFCSGFGV